MRWAAEVRIGLRDGIADPEGQTVGAALVALGHAGVERVRVGKLIRIELEAAGHDEARAAVSDMCARLLANPVMEVAAFDISPLDAP